MRAARRVESQAGLQSLIVTLLDLGYRVVGPLVRDEVIVYDDLDSAADMPRGVTVEQQPGRWRLHQSDRASTAVPQLRVHPQALQSLARSRQLHSSTFIDRQVHDIGPLPEHW